MSETVVEPTESVVREPDGVVAKKVGNKPEPAVVEPAIDGTPRSERPVKEDPDTDTDPHLVPKNNSEAKQPDWK